MSREEQLINAAHDRFESTQWYHTDMYHKLCEIWVEGAKFADSHPNGFINYEPKRTMTNKEFIARLKEFPEDANVCIECCNPRAMVYDEENNLIRID